MSTKENNDCAERLIFEFGSGDKESWRKAHAWTDKINRESDLEEYEAPQWSFDCSFKLNYDGPILSASSRFYPPWRHESNFWEGSISVYLMGEELLEFKLAGKDLSEIHKKATGYTDEVVRKLKEFIKCGGLDDIAV